jgi:hypothetical protein
MELKLIILQLVLGALMSKFKETSEESTREAIAVAFKELLRIASTQVRNYDRELVPFLYFAKNDPAESVRNPFKVEKNEKNEKKNRKKSHYFFLLVCFFLVFFAFFLSSLLFSCLL